MKRLGLFVLICAAGLAGCGKEHRKTFKNSESPLVNGPSDITDPEEEGADQKAAQKLTLTCPLEENKAYKGFGGTDLIVGRATEVPMQGNRYRIKPYSTLDKEFTRVTGKAPPSLAANVASFAAPADRWYVEPSGSAVALFTLYRIAYEAALGYVATDAKWAVAPTEASAKVECQLFARVAWNREPIDTEIAACAQIAAVDTASETDPKMRWAYALASVLNATGFIAY